MESRGALPSVLMNPQVQTSSMQMDVTITPEKEENGALSETSFIITPKSQPFTYGTNYVFKIQKGLKPKYGTEPLSAELNQSLRTTDFMQGIETLQSVADSSGQLVDTKSWNIEM